MRSKLSVRRRVARRRWELFGLQIGMVSEDLDVAEFVGDGGDELVLCQRA